MKSDQSSVIHFACTYINQQNQLIAELKDKINKLQNNNNNNNSSNSIDSTKSENDNSNTAMSPTTSSSPIESLTSSALQSNTVLYKHIQDTQSSLYRISIDNGAVTEVNNMVEISTGYHRSVILNKPMCSRPLCWQLYYLPTQGQINQSNNSSYDNYNNMSMVKQEDDSYVNSSNNDIQITDINDLPYDLTEDQLTPLFPSHCFKLNQQTRYNTDSTTRQLTMQQITYLINLLNQNINGIKLLCRINTAMNETMEFIAHISVQHNNTHNNNKNSIIGNTSNSSIIMLCPIQQQRIVQPSYDDDLLLNHRIKT